MARKERLKRQCRNIVVRERSKACDTEREEVEHRQPRLESLRVFPLVRSRRELLQDGLGKGRVDLDWTLRVEVSRALTRIGGGLTLLAISRTALHPILEAPDGLAGIQDLSIDEGTVGAFGFGCERGSDVRDRFAEGLGRRVESCNDSLCEFRRDTVPKVLSVPVSTLAGTFTRDSRSVISQIRREHLAQREERYLLAGQSDRMLLVSLGEVEERRCEGLEVGDES